MQMKKRLEGETVILTVEANRIDAANAVYLKDAFSKSISDEAGRILMDLNQVTFMDSSGLGAMVAAMKQLNGTRKLELCNLSPAVDKVFTLTRMYTVFGIHPDMESALSNDGTKNNVSAA